MRGERKEVGFAEVRTTTSLFTRMKSGWPKRERRQGRVQSPTKWSIAVAQQLCVLWFEVKSTHVSLVEPPFPGQDEVIGNALNLRQVVRTNVKHVILGAFFVSFTADLSNAREIRADLGSPGERIWVVGVVKVENFLAPEVNLQSFVSHLKAVAPDALGFGVNLGCVTCIFTGELCI
jgi:hypothetical protein